jgi:hypothetical protein
MLTRKGNPADLNAEQRLADHFRDVVEDAGGGKLLVSSFDVQRSKGVPRAVR